MQRTAARKDGLPTTLLVGRQRKRFGRTVRGSKSESSAAKIVEQLGPERIRRQHFRLSTGQVVEVEALLITRDEASTCVESHEPEWARIDLGPLVLLQRLRD